MGTRDRLLLVNAVLTALYAVMLLAAPAQFFSMRALPADDVAVFIARLMGPSQIGYAVLSLIASAHASADVRRLVSSIVAITWSVGFLVLALGALTLQANLVIWGDVATAGLFSGLFIARALRPPAPRA